MVGVLWWLWWCCCLPVCLVDQFFNYLRPYWCCAVLCCAVLSVASSWGAPATWPNNQSINSFLVNRTS